MTTWILEDLEDNVPYYQIIKEKNLHKVYKQIGWRYTVYKCNDKDVIIPTEKNNVFKFKGLKCTLIENSDFNSNFIPCTACLSEKDLEKSSTLKENFEYVKNYEYFKDIVEYEEIETKTICLPIGKTIVLKEMIENQVLEGIGYGRNGGYGCIRFVKMK